MKNSYVYFADYGVYLTGVDNTLGYRALIDSCEFDECGVGIYANNSRVEVTNTSITNSDMGTMYGTGIYLTNTTAGQVILDGNAITDNGTDGTYSSAGVYLSSSDPELINSLIEDNSGAGITCFNSVPDLNTHDLIDPHPNDIHSNGTGSQSGSDGAEIYLASSSYPDINYNNIWDWDTGPVGYAIYKDYPSNKNGLNAKFNYWGTSTPDLYESDLFYWGSGTAITYYPWESSYISTASVEDYEIAMRLWQTGEYEEAARYFRRCVNDTGRVGVNSVHYLTGCTGEMEDGDFRALRRFLFEVAEDHDDAEVAHVATRFATHCLTEMGEYEDALEEYDRARRNADCLMDSVMAVVDYLAVLELVEGIDRGASIEDNVPTQMSKVMALLRERKELADAELPEDFAITQAYPNPFNSTTIISYNLHDDAKVRLVIHDLQGRELAVIHDSPETAGVHTLQWDATGFPSGIYLCRMAANSHTTTMKLTMIR